MSGKRQSQLSEGQKDCLRLVNDHRTSKEIARVLGISPFTVDQRLDAARKKLKATSRTEAARLFALAEEGKISEPLVYYSGRVAAAGEHDISTSHPNRVGQAEVVNAFVEYGFNQDLVLDQTGIKQRVRSFLPVPPIGGARHDLSKRNVLIQSLNVAFFSTLTIAVVIVLLTGAMRLLR